MSRLTNRQFVDRLLDICHNYRTIYMWGSFGSPVIDRIIDRKAQQYPSWYTEDRRQALMQLAGHGYFGFDCSGLIKAILWGWCGDHMQTSGGARYLANGVPDFSANGLLNYLQGVTTNFAGILPGEAVWLSGHVGVYIGDGKVIEATPAWKNCVQVTTCLNVTGGMMTNQARLWAKRGRLPWIDYMEG